MPIEKFGNYKRNSPAWAFDKLRSDMLVQILSDLQNVQNTGIDEETCQLVAKAIGSMVNLTTGIPDKSIFRKQIWKEMQDFESLYLEWNQISGTPPEAADKRFQKLRQLRKKRNSIATVVRKNKHIINHNLDLILIDDTYEAFGTLVKSAPEIFKNAHKAVQRYLGIRECDTNNDVG